MRTRRQFVSLCAALLACLHVPPSRATAPAAAETLREIFLARGISAYDADRFDEAVGILRGAAERYPRDREIRYHLGLALAGAGNLDDCCAVLGRLHREDPDFIPGGVEYAAALIRARRWGEAGAVIDALGARPASPGGEGAVAFLRGVLEGEQGRYARAVEILGMVRQEDEYWGRARYFRGLYLSRAGDTRGALDEYDQIEKSAPLSDIARSAADEARVLRGAQRAGKNWGARVSTRYEYDDNVILMPDDNALPGATNQDDWRFLTTFELDAVPLTRGPFDLVTRYQFVQSVHNRLGNYNMNGNVLDGFVRYRHPLLTPFAGYEFAYYFLDDCKQSYLRANRIFAGAELPRTAHSLYRVLYECAFDDYLLPYSSPADNWDAAPQSTVWAEQFLFLGRARGAFWRTAAGFTNNNARGSEFYYNGLSLLGELFCPLPLSCSADCTVEYRFNDFRRNSEGRRDSCLEMNAELRRNLRGGVDLVFNYSFTGNGSSVPLYRYKRGIYSMILELYF